MHKIEAGYREPCIPRTRLHSGRLSKTLIPLQMAPELRRVLRKWQLSYGRIMWLWLRLRIDADVGDTHQRMPYLQNAKQTSADQDTSMKVLRALRDSHKPVRAFRWSSTRRTKSTLDNNSADRLLGESK